MTDEWGEPISSLPPRHDFQNDGDLIGTLVSTETRALNDPNDPGSKKDTALYIFRKDDGATVALWGAAQLDQLLPGHVGSRLKVVDTGEKESIGGGRSVRKFNVYVSKA